VTAPDYSALLAGARLKIVSSDGSGQTTKVLAVLPDGTEHVVNAVVAVELSITRGESRCKVTFANVELEVAALLTAAKVAPAPR
jgi:hypothetical protein